MAVQNVIFKHLVEERDTAVPIGKGTPHKPNSIGMREVVPFEDLGTSGATNLTYTAGATTGVVASDTGTDATIPLATATNAGLLPPVPATTALTSGAVDAAADYFLIWDNSASAYKKILADFTTAGSGITNLAYTAAPTTGTVTSDTGTDATVPLATGTDAGLLPPVPATTALTASGVDTAADYMLIWDNSASAYKKILPTFVNAGADVIGTHNGATFRYAILTGTPTVTYDTSTATAPILTVAGGTIKIKELWVPYTSGGSTDPIFLINGTVSATRFYSTPIVTKVIENSTTPTLAGTYNQQDVDNTPQVRFGDYTATSVSVQLASVTGSWNFGFLFSMNQ